MTGAEIVYEGVWREKNSNSVASTQLSNGYIISTIDRTPVKGLDEFINFATKVAGITIEEQAEMTEAGFRADLGMEGDFETMVFRCDEDGEVTNWEEQAFARYATREEAEKGHKEMVERWRLMPEV